MTAIAVIFDHVKNHFVIGADGRSKSFDPTLPIFDSVQKVFPICEGSICAAYSMSGLATIGSFDSNAHVAKQASALAKRPFANGYEFAAKLSFNLKRVFEKALKDGAIHDIPTHKELPPQERGRFLKLFLAGFYNRSPFLICHSLYFHGKNAPVEKRQNDFDLSPSQSRAIHTGCDQIAAMLFGNAPVDPRFSHYKKAMEGSDALGAITSYIRACSDPAAITIDPYCGFIGGHMHAAEVSAAAFQWLLPPISPATYS